MRPADRAYILDRVCERVQGARPWPRDREMGREGPDGAWLVLTWSGAVRDVLVAVGSSSGWVVALRGRGWRDRLVDAIVEAVGRAAHG